MRRRIASGSGEIQGVLRCLCVFMVDLCTLEQTLGHSHKTDGFAALLDLAFLMAKKKKGRKQKTEKGSSNKLLRSGKGTKLGAQWMQV